MQRPRTAKAVKPTDSGEITCEQYLAEFQSEPPTMQPCEIIEGIRHIMNSPLLPHQITTFKIATRFNDYDYGERTGVGQMIISPFDVVIRRRPRLKVRQPDVLFISKARFDAVGEAIMSGPLETAPELIVEVLSPSETPRIIRAKIEGFRSIGVLEAWIVSMEAETVQIQRLAAEGIETVATYAHGQTIQSVVFPDLRIAVAEIFAA